MLTGTVLSPWIVLPLGAIAMLLTAIHISYTEQHTEPASRRRIRMANGWVLLLLIPLLAAGFGVIDPNANARMFALVWFAAIVLLGLCVCLAVLDMLNTLRLSRNASRYLSHAASARTREELRRRGMTNNAGAGSDGRDD